MIVQVDLTGETFGKWKVLKRVDGSHWECECQCESKTHKIVRQYSLLSGDSTSCGCGRVTRQINNLVGQMFGRWKVLEYKGNSRWLCECQCSAKTIKIVAGRDLKSGGTKSCGCLRKELLHKKDTELVEVKKTGKTTINVDGHQLKEDLTGRKFGAWTVLKYAGDYKWKCECSCDNHTIREVSRYDLINGKSTNCGCKRSRDLTGKTFGRLTVNKYLGHMVWDCTCSCSGKHIQVLTCNLVSGGTKSCGCIKNESKHSKDEYLRVMNDIYKETGELPYLDEIAEKLMLHKENVRHNINKYNLWEYINKVFRSKPEREVAKSLCTKDFVSNCRSVLPGGKELDIYIPSKNLAIEYNGDYWHSTEKLESNYHQLKTIEAAKNGVRLIHIFEHEWNDLRKRELLINHINRLVEDNRNIEYCTHIKELNKEEAVKFLHKNAINVLDSENYLGLYNISGDLIGITQINQDPNNRFTLTNIKIEIVNTIYKNGTKVINGIEKIIKYLTLKYSASTITTKIDISKFTGNQYLKAGFKLTNIENPKHIWINVVDGNIMHFDNVDESILEKVEDLVKVEDCGYLRLAWVKE